MTKKIVKRTDANNETLYFYTHSDAVDVGEGSSTKSLTEVIDDTLHKSAQTLTNAEKTQVLVNLGLNGVDDVPTENSKNIVRSGGVKAAIDDVIDDFTNRGFMYKGIAPASAPLGEDKTFYIAKSGDYTAYTGIGDGSFTLNGIAVLTYATTTASGAWTKNDIVLFDDEPTAGSDNLVKSGGIYEKIIIPHKENESNFIIGKAKAIGDSAINTIYDSIDGAACMVLPVRQGEVYKIFAKATSSKYGLYTVVDYSLKILEKRATGNTRTKGLDITIPKGGRYLIVNSIDYNTETDKVVKIYDNTKASIDKTVDLLKYRNVALFDTCVCFGDSITENKYFGGGYVDYLQKLTSATFVNAAKGGSRYVPREVIDSSTVIDTSSKAYAALDVLNIVKGWCNNDYTKIDEATSFLQDNSIAQRIAILKTYRPTDVDCVTILAGTNDFSSSTPIGTPDDVDESTVCGALNIIITLLENANSHLKIFILSPLVRFVGTREDANWCDVFKRENGDSVPKLVESIIATATKRHIPVCDLYNGLGWNKENFSAFFGSAQSNTVHPTNGYKELATKIYGFLLSGITTPSLQEIKQDIDDLENEQLKHDVALSEIQSTLDGREDSWDVAYEKSYTWSVIPTSTTSVLSSYVDNIPSGTRVKIEIVEGFGNVVNAFNYYYGSLSKIYVQSQSVEFTLVEDCSRMYISLENSFFITAGKVKVKVSTYKEASRGIVEELSDVMQDVENIKDTLDGEPQSIISLIDGDRTYTAIPSGTSQIKIARDVELHKGERVVFEMESSISTIFNQYNYYVEGLMSGLQAVNSDILRIEVDVTEDITAQTVYLSVRNSQWKNDASEHLPLTFHVNISIIKPKVKGLVEKVADIEETMLSGVSYERLIDAVEERKTGIIQVGENIVVGLKTIESPSAADIEANYVNILPNPKFPMIKKVSLARLYDDAATPNMLYICSHSDKHIFYSICPTDTKHIDYESFEQYNSNYFYYADKNTPSDLTKVVLPTTVNGVNIARRIKYVFEMSDGDCLVEIENGAKYNTQNGKNNLYKVSNVFSGNSIQESDVTLSLSFDVRNERISAFDQIQEYKAGHIVLAPYGSGATAKVYITKNYGSAWECVFCGNTSNNAVSISPKARHLGTETAYGEYPTNEVGLGEGSAPIDWSATGNGNVHIHGIAYDRWYDRIWICTGDGGGLENSVTGIWWTDDEGYTWYRIGNPKDINTQLMGVIPMEHCILFSTDGYGDGYWRWSRNGKDKIIKPENCYNFLGINSSLVVEAGRSIKTKSGFVLTSFAPDNASQGDWENAGGIVATYNGFSFEKIYKDSFTEGTFETAEIGWSCDITDCGDKLILKADKGGYIQLDY